MIELTQKQSKGVRFLRTFKIAYHKNKYFTAQMKNFIDLCISSSAQKQENTDGSVIFSH